MMRFEPVSELLGKPVFDVTGEHIGWASEVLIDFDEGRIEYVRVMLSNDDGRASRKVVIPWSAIHHKGPSADELRIDARRAVLHSLALRQNRGESVQDD